MRPPLDIPARLAKRPRDQRGLPIPYSVKMVDGVPDFRVTEPRRWRVCVDHRKCQLCGMHVKHSLWFVGGQACARHRLFQDPGMHRDCAEFALRICPFLSMRSGYSDLEKRPPPVGMALIPGTENMGKPDRFMLGAATDSAIVLVEGVPFIRATPWLALHWWKDGEELAASQQEETSGEPI